jgi:hypothetical protein
MQKGAKMVQLATHQYKAAFTLMCVIAVLTTTDRVKAQESTPTATPAPMASAPTPTEERWRIGVTPYLWLPTANATFRFKQRRLPFGAGLPDARTFDVQIGPNKYLSHLNSAIMLTVEARKGGGSAFGDIIYTNFSNTTASVINISGPAGMISVPFNVSTSARITTTIATVGFGGTFAKSPVSYADGFVGLRYIDLTVGASWSLTGPLGIFPAVGDTSETKSDTAGILGVRGRLGLGGHWVVPLYADYGASGQLTTYQWIAGISHAGHSNALIIAWRQLYYNQNNDLTGLIRYLNLGGPAIGYTFYF